MNTIPQLSCPTCSSPNTWQENNSYKPFCSARCKLIDLGEWAGETRRIPGENVPLAEEYSVHEELY